MRKILLTILLLNCLIAKSQQPQAQSNQPIIPNNSKWTNGIAPGYYPTKGAGLTLNISSGTAACDGTISSYAGGTLTMTNAVTNYIYIDKITCVPTVSTSIFAANQIPIAIVVAAGGVITTITDDRTFFITNTNITPGYKPSNGGGLNLNISAGSVFCGGVITTYTASFLVQIASQTNYNYIDRSTCVPTVSTTIWSQYQIPIALTTTNGSSILTIVDDREFFSSQQEIIVGALNPLFSSLTGVTYTVSCPGCGTDNPVSSIHGQIIGENFAPNGTFAVGTGSWSLCGTNTAARGTYPIDYMPIPVSGYIRNPVFYITTTPVIGSSQRFQFTRSNGLIPDLIEGLFGYIENTTAGVYGSANHNWRTFAGDEYELTVGAPTSGGAITSPSYGVEFVSDGNYDGILCSHWTIATNTAIANGTTYLGPFSSNGGLSSNATENLVKYTVPIAGTFSNMFFWSNLAGTGSSSTVLTFRKNGAGCSITKTLHTEAIGLYVDVINTCVVAAGDQVDWQVVCTVGTGACVSIHGISIAFKATSGGCSPNTAINCASFLGTTPIFTATAGTTNYASPFSKNINTTEANQRFGLSFGGVLSTCNVFVGTASSGGNSTVITVMKNGSAGTGAVTISSGISGNVAFTGSDTFVFKDYMDFRIVSTGGVGPVISSISCLYQ